MAVSTQCQERRATPRKADEKSGVGLWRRRLQRARRSSLSRCWKNKVPIPNMAAGTSIGRVAALAWRGPDAQQMQCCIELSLISSTLQVRPAKRLIPRQAIPDLRTAPGTAARGNEIPSKTVAPVDLISRKRILSTPGDTAIAVKASSR